MKKRTTLRKRELRRIVGRVLREQAESVDWSKHLEPLKKDLQPIWNALHQWKSVSSRLNHAAEDSGIKRKIERILIIFSDNFLHDVMHGLAPSWDAAVSKHLNDPVNNWLVGQAPEELLKFVLYSIRISDSYDGNDARHYSALADELGISEGALLKELRGSAIASSYRVAERARQASREISKVIEEAKKIDKQPPDFEHFLREEFKNYDAAVINHITRPLGQRNNAAVLAVIVRYLRDGKLPSYITGESRTILKDLEEVGLVPGALKFESDSEEFTQIIFTTMRSRWSDRIKRLDLEDAKLFAAERLRRVSRFGEVIQEIKAAVGGPDFTSGNPEQWARSNRVKSSADAPLGWIAFSPERMPSEDIPYEPNTPIESEVRDSMLAYANDNTDIEPDKASLIKNLLAGQYYEDAIRYTPKSVKTVYRGMALSDVDVDRLGPGLQEALFNLEPNEPARTIEYSFVYKPRNPSGLSSWSDDFRVAKMFADQNVLDAIDGSDGPSAFAIVLQADIADNPEGFLDALHLFKKMGLRNALVSEREHLGLHEIKISRMTALRVNVAGLSDDDEDEENRSGMGFYQLMNTLSPLAPKFSPDGKMILNK